MRRRKKTEQHKNKICALFFLVLSRAPFCHGCTLPTASLLCVSSCNRDNPNTPTVRVLCVSIAASMMLRQHFSRWRPYRVECTGSLLTSEVKRRRARLVLGWGTAWEDLRVLPALHIHQLALMAGGCGANKDTVAHLAPSSGHCKAFSPTIPPLQVALSFACSVASLSHSPSFQLPGWHSLHCGSLADYLLGWGRASTCTAGHTELQYVPMSKLPFGSQELPPSNN